MIIFDKTNCKHCSKEFIKKRVDNVFCSRNCSIYSWNKLNNYKPNINKDKRKIYLSKYRETNKESIVASNSNWYENNKIYISIYNKQYRIKNTNKVNLINKKWKEQNKDHISIRSKTRYNSDPIFRLKSILRSRLKLALKNNQKIGSAVVDLGCSINKLKIHLQLMFHRNPRDKHEYMTWDNYGEWHIDHIRPLSSFDLSNKNEFKKACHYTNLQPLWAIDNLKKSNKI